MSELNTSRLAALAAALNGLGGPANAHLTMGEAEMLAAVHNILSSGADVSHLTSSYGQILAALHNVVSASPDLSNLSASQNQIVAAIRNALTADPDLSPLTTSAAALWSGAMALLAGAGVPTDPYFSSVVLLLQFAGADASTSFTDLSGSAKTVTRVGDAQVDTAQSKFGGSSLLLDNAGDSLTLADSPDWKLSAANSDQFTIELWVRPVSIGNPDQVIGQRPGGGNGGAWSIVFLNAGKVEFSLGSPSGDVFVGSATGAVVTGAWQFLTVDKDATGKIRLYVDGVMKASSTPTDSAMVDFPDVLSIGNNGAGWAYDGWIDDVRVTKGVARYASDAGFTLPTASFPTA